MKVSEHTALSEKTEIWKQKLSAIMGVALQCRWMTRNRNSAMVEISPHYTEVHLFFYGDRAV